MRKALVFMTFAVLFLSLQTVSAQNTSPYWSLAGNSTATTSSKLGTTTAIPLRLYTKNSERLRIDTLGNVGIGTTTIGSRLTVNSASGASPLKVQINASTKLYMSSGGGLSVGSGTAAPSSGLYVSGNVGVGTAAPASGYKMDVEAGSNSGILVNSTNVGIRSNGTNSGVYGTGSSNGGVGVYGTGYYGVRGEGSFYAGYFSSTAGNGSSFGVYATGNSTGLYGSGGTYGVYGTVTSTTSVGVYGNGGTSYSAPSSEGSAGVYGTGFYGVKGNGHIGVEGTSDNNVGVDGQGVVGVHGYSTTSGHGVYGESSGTYNSNGSAGVYGYGYYGTYGQGSSVGIGAYGNGAYGVYGIGTSWGGYFQGPVYSTGTFNSSDRKLKKNIADFTSAMDIISKLQPKSYEYRQDGNYKLMNLPEGKHYGLIAQDVEQVLPNLVKESSFDVRVAKQAPAKPDSGRVRTASTTTQQPAEVIDFKAVNYTELIPIMVKAMQEQEAKIDEKDKRISSLETEVAELRQMVLNLKNGVNAVTSIGTLSQATPNPANGSTRISYTLPNSSGHAQLLVTDAVGKTIKAISLNGSGSVDVNTTSLSSGTYNYTLYVDGKQVDTKRLVIAR